MIPMLHADKITEFIVPTLVKACSDKVPNVQFTNSKLINLHKSSFDQNTFKERIVPQLRLNMSSGDKDVAYYA